MSRSAAVACLAAVAALGGCHPSSGAKADGRPQPSARGRSLGVTTALTIGVDGGTVTSVDGRLTVIVPAGAFAIPVDVTVDEITDTAPGKLDDVAYRLGPSDVLPALPVTLVFQAAAPGSALGGFTVAYQEHQGFWLRQREVARDPASGTLTLATTHLGDWSIVTDSPRDLHGRVTFQSTRGIPFSATGVVTLNEAGGDAASTYYLQWGTLTLDPAQLTSGTAVCTPDAASVDLDTDIAEVLTLPDRFRWGVTGRWPLTCTDGGVSSPDLASLFFDTMGIYLPGCARSYPQAPVIAPDHLQGAYTIDCGADGAVTATWDMATCTAGVACLPCHAAVTSCDTGTSVCVDSGALPDGTSCNGTGTCTAGVCSVP